MTSQLQSRRQPCKPLSQGPPLGWRRVCEAECHTDGHHPLGLGRSTSSPSLRSDADRLGWVPLQVSWLDARGNPVQRSAEGPPPKRYSPSTLRLSTLGYTSKLSRNTRTEVLHQATNLEQVMRARMKLYDSSFEAYARSVADGEEIFSEPSPSIPSGTRSQESNASRSSAAGVAGDPLFLRPRHPSSPGTNAQVCLRAQVNHGGSPESRCRPWTTSEAPVAEEDPDEFGDAWQPLIAGLRPWPASRDQHMRQLLPPGRTLKRTVDGAMCGGVVAENDERNTFYMTLNTATKPSSRSF